MRNVFIVTFYDIDTNPYEFTIETNLSYDELRQKILTLTRTELLKIRGKIEEFGTGYVNFLDDIMNKLAKDNDVARARFPTIEFELDDLYESMEEDFFEEGN